MNLNQILDNLQQPFELVGNIQDTSSTLIHDVAIDSRKVQKNSIFFGIIGKKNDGANFIFEAFKRGCKVFAISNESNFDYNKFINDYSEVIIIIGNVHEILTETLKILYNSLPQNIYAITGTNGKTSTAEYVRQILEFINLKSASIGTLGVRTNNLSLNNFIDAGLTTPDLVSLYKNLALLKTNGVDDVAVEVSSIGLEQGRADGLRIGTGAFTNFTQDHLDYHQNMANYFACKMILFDKLVLPNGNAVLNADILEFDNIKKICERRGLKIFDYGFNAQTLKIIDINKGKAKFKFNHIDFEFQTNLKGDFQVYNVLCALGCVISMRQLNHQEINRIIAKFDQLNSASGRMQLAGELAGEAQGAKIFIDFAHSPDALENVLKLARQIAQNRVIILFGCGGDRDAKKRPIMGGIASKLADLIIITDDNPRTENPESIRQQILANCDLSKTTEIADRKNAILKSIQILKSGDVLIIAGKGHENYQIIGSQKFEFNEDKIVKDAIKQLS